MCNSYPAVCVCARSVASVVSDSLRPYGLGPTRLFCLWDSPGKSTGVEFSWRKLKSSKFHALGQSHFWQLALVAADVLPSLIPLPGVGLALTFSPRFLPVPWLPLNSWGLCWIWPQPPFLPAATRVRSQHLADAHPRPPSPWIFCCHLCPAPSCPMLSHRLSLRLPQAGSASIVCRFGLFLPEGASLLQCLRSQAPTPPSWACEAGRPPAWSPPRPACPLSSGFLCWQWAHGRDRFLSPEKRKRKEVPFTGLLHVFPCSSWDGVCVCERERGRGRGRDILLFRAGDIENGEGWVGKWKRNFYFVSRQRKSCRKLTWDHLSSLPPFDRILEGLSEVFTLIHQFHS